MKLRLLLTIQLIGLFLLLNTPVQSNSAHLIRHSITTVLGAFIAQDIPPADQTVQDTTQPTPTDEPSPSPTETMPASPATDVLQAPINQPEPQATPAQDETSLLNPTPTPQESPSAEITPSLSEIAQGNSVQESTFSTDTSLSSTVNDNVTNPGSSIETADNVAQTVIDKAGKEDQEIEAEQDPKQQTDSLINLAGEKVTDINQSISQNDFSTGSFLTQRLTNQIEKAQENLQKINPADKKSLEQKLKTFCKQADLGLKSEQLTVPEELEQDIEIARGLCLSVQ